MDAIAELEKYRQDWRRVHLRNPVISNREIGTIRVSDPPFQLTKVVVYRRDAISNKLHRHGAEIGSSYTAEHRPRCLHLSLLNDEWGPTHISPVSRLQRISKRGHRCLSSAGFAVYTPPLRSREALDVAGKWMLERQEAH